MHFWYHITSLGDSGLSIPTGLAIAVCLSVSHRVRLAVIWTALLALAILIVTITKLMFMGWGIGIESVDFTGISGHATLAAFVLPVLVRLAATAWRPRYAGPCCYVGEALAVLVGLSRLALHVHSLSEVIAGFALGFSLSYFFISVLRNSADVALRPWLVGLAVVAIIPLMMREPAPSHPLLEKIATSLSGHRGVFKRPMRPNSSSQSECRR